MNSQDSRRGSKLIDVDIVHSNHRDVLMILQNDTVLLKKLRCVEILVSQYISSMQENELEKEILCGLMPCAKELLNSLFENAVELAFDNQQEKCPQTLFAIQECLQMVLNLLEILEDLLVFVNKRNKRPINVIQSIPFQMSQIIYSTFLHCKESQNFYKIYFDSISEILQIFKKTQDLHVKLLKLLDSHVTINTLNEGEMLMLKDILDDIVNIGFLLSGMNVKSMADNWKGYTSLTQKYSDGLCSIIDIRSPLEFFTIEILKSLDKLFELPTCDLKSSTNSLKVSNFLAKVMSKMCVSFYDTLKCHFEAVWVFFIKLYSFCPSLVKQKHVSQAVIDMIDSSLICVFDPLVEKLSIDSNFYQNDAAMMQAPSSYLLVTSALLKSLSSHHPKAVNNLDFSHIFGSVFSVLKKCLGIIIENKNISSGLLTSLPVLIFNLNNTHFPYSEEILCKNLLGSNVWCALFAQEIWLSVIRLSNPKYAEGTLSFIVNGTKSLLRAKFTYRMEQVIISTFIKNIFCLLTAQLKQKFIEQYPIVQNLFIWQSIGLDALPKNATHHIEQCIARTVTAMEQLESGNCTQQEFMEMVDLIKLISTIPFEEVYFDLNRLTSVLLALWNMETVEDLVEYQFFDLLLEALFSLTNALLWRLDASQFVEILEVIKTLLKSTQITKLLTLELLANANIEKLCSNYQSKEFIYSNISEILMCLLTEDVIIRMKAYEILTIYSNNSVTREIVKNTLQELPRVKVEYTKFAKRSINSCTPSSIYEQLENREFIHKCIDVKDIEQSTKKLKLDESTAVNIGINKLKEDVLTLKELIKTNSITTENVAEISTLIGELHSCLR